MKEKEQTSLQFNNISWDLFRLGERTLLLQGPSDILIENVHDSTRRIKEALGDDLNDIVPAYTSIALFHSGDTQQLVNQLSNHKITQSKKSLSIEKIQLPICYEYGLDLEDVAKHAGMTPEKLIETHLKGTYRAILIGFTPGFIYVDGLDPKLACPRKANPRKFLDPGTIGIGGEQTGIYSLASPGGWNIIGRTPVQLFDASKQPPMAIDVGSEVSYYQITKREFEEWEN